MLTADLIPDLLSVNPFFRLGANRITASAKVMKRSYKNDGWYYTLKINDGSEIEMGESYIMEC